MFISSYCAIDRQHQSENISSATSNSNSSNSALNDSQISNVYYENFIS